MITEKTYVTCINLARRPDRRLRAWGQFRKEGLKVERLVAVDALGVSEARGFHHVGARACAASHRMAWRAARKAGAEAVLVFEDDVVLAPEFLAKVAALEVPDDWDVIYLGCTLREAPEDLGGGVVRVRGKTWDWHAMLVHSRTWSRLHSLLAPLGRRGHVARGETSCDGLLAEHHKKFQVYAAWPPLAWQTFGLSNLENAVRGCWDAEGRQLMFRSVVRQLPPTAKGGWEQQWQGYWEGASHFGTLLNKLGLKDTVVEVGAGDGSFTRTALPGWQGQHWHVIDPWTADPTRWTDELAWDAKRLQVMRGRLTQWQKADGRMQIKMTSEADAVADYQDASLDAVWLDGDHSYSGMIGALDRWWPKVRSGGVMGGGSAGNLFQGLFRGPHTWQLSLRALQEWAQRNQVALIRSHQTTEEDGPWLIFKFDQPKPEEITVISASTSNIEYAKITEANHRAYCTRRGYQYHVFGDADFDDSRSPPWSKIRFFQHQLQQSPWVFWIDSDAIFNDWEWKIEHFAHLQFSLICGIYHQNDRPRPSTGVCLMQAGPEAEELLNKIWEHYPTPHIDGHEEAGFKAALDGSPELRQRVFAMPVRNLNSHPPLNDWGIDDPVLHFLQLKETRAKLIEDACAMAKDRAARQERMR